MIKINDRFSIDRDSNGCTLFEYTPGTNRDGEPTIGERRRFYPNIEQAVDAMIELAPVGAGSMDEFVASFAALRKDMERVRDELLEAVCVNEI